MALFGNFGTPIIESLQAVELDGEEDKEIEVSRGGFWARLFDTDPTLHLWDKTKKVTIKVPHYKPAMYWLVDRFIVHPSLMPKIKEAIENQNKSSKTYGW